MVDIRNKYYITQNEIIGVNYDSVFNDFLLARNETNGSPITSDLKSSNIKCDYKANVGSSYGFSRMYFEFPKINTNRAIKRAFFVIDTIGMTSTAAGAREYLQNVNTPPTNPDYENKYCDVSLIESSDHASDYVSSASTRTNFPGFVNGSLVSKDESTRVRNKTFVAEEIIEIELNEYIINKLTQQKNTFCLVQHNDYVSDVNTLEYPNSSHFLNLHKLGHNERTSLQIEYEPLTACKGETITLESEFIRTQAGFQWFKYNDSTEEWDLIPGEYNGSIEVDESIGSNRIKLNSFDNDFNQKTEYFEVDFINCVLDACKGESITLETENVNLVAFQWYYLDQTTEEWVVLDGEFEDKITISDGDIPSDTLLLQSSDSNYTEFREEFKIKFINCEPDFIACIGESILLESENPNYTAFIWYKYNNTNETYEPFQKGIGNRQFVEETGKYMVQVYDSSYNETREYFKVKFVSCSVRSVIIPNSITKWDKTNEIKKSITESINDAKPIGSSINRTPTALSSDNTTLQPGYSKIYNNAFFNSGYSDPEGNGAKYIKFYSNDVNYNSNTSNDPEIGLFYWNGTWTKIDYKTPPLSFPINISINDTGTTTGRSSTFRYKVTDSGTPDYRYSTAMGQLEVDIKNPNLPPNQLTNMEKSMAYNKSIKFRGAELQVDYNDPDGDKAKEFRFSNFNNQGIKLEYWSGSNWVEVNSLNNTAPGANTIKGFRDFRTRCDGSVASPKSHTFKYKVKDVGSNQFSSVEGEIKINVGGGVVISDKFRGSSSSRQFQTSACNLSKDRDYWISSMPIGIGKIVYLNSSKNFKLNGGNNFYKLENSSFKVDNTGRIIGTGYLCF